LIELLRADDDGGLPLVGHPERDDLEHDAAEIWSIVHADTNNCGICAVSW